jgi:hypothetical protein
MMRASQPERSAEGRLGQSGVGQIMRARHRDDGRLIEVMVDVETFLGAFGLADALDLPCRHRAWLAVIGTLRDGSPSSRSWLRHPSVPAATVCW